MNANSKIVAVNLHCDGAFVWPSRSVAHGLAERSQTCMSRVMPMNRKLHESPDKLAENKSERLTVPYNRLKLSVC